jgi:hypothetical protein
MDHIHLQRLGSHPLTALDGSGIEMTDREVMQHC